MSDSDPQGGACTKAQIAHVEQMLAEVAAPAETSDESDLRALHVGIARQYLEKLAVEKEAAREVKRLAADEAKFRNYKARYGWSRDDYTQFCAQPPDVQGAILSAERSKRYRTKKRDGKPARAWEHRSAEDRAEQKRQRERERYQFKKAAKITKE
ncbi:hypothetical protein [Paenirhodobacter populi]|uniref:Uncharacterized protein n=1 Tax=Paenirhodobacter populi TaxID=2306993 RepID=A0A443JLQ3_9RHOB|nr:hypothetical protein [Sinirhodobacter populi]RWR21126.1 hypothetical protein D2T30_09795 [Sinirhodobacter populi]